jgi:hypothetical protein
VDKTDTKQNEVARADAIITNNSGVVALPELLIV